MRKPLLIWTVAAIAILTAWAGAAYAAVSDGTSPVDTSGVIHGCYGKANANGMHVFKLISAGMSCPGAETAITWNEIGPEGATGPMGAPAPTATPDPPVVVTSESDPSNWCNGVCGFLWSGWMTVTAQCPANAPYVVSGYAMENTDTPYLSEPFDVTANANLSGAETSGSIYGQTGTLHVTGYQGNPSLSLPVTTPSLTVTAYCTS